MSKSGKMFVRDSSKGSYQWKRQVSEAAAKYVKESGLWDGPLLLSLSFYVPRPQGHFNGKGELNAKGLRTPYPITRPDLLKTARAVEDSLSGVVYRDDAQIVEEKLYKLYGEPARVELTIRQLPVE